MAAYRALVVLRMDPADAGQVAAAFGEHDRTGLPGLIGVRRRVLFRFHDLYLHLVESDRDITENLYRARGHPDVRELHGRLATVLAPYPAGRAEHGDVLAEAFYTWEVAGSSPVPGHAATAGPAAPVAASAVPPNRRLGGDIRALLTPASVGAVSGFMGTVDLGPGESVSEHYHPFSDKFLYLVGGELVVVVDGEPVALRPHEALLVGRGTRHRIENRGTAPARAVFQVTPLAPCPHLGHVETEPVPAPGCEPPGIGGAA